MRTVHWVIVSLLLVPAVSHAQSAFDGTWRPDYSPTQPGKPVISVLADGMYDCQGCEHPYKIKADGRDQPVAGHPYFDSVNATIIDQRKIRIIGKKKGTVIEAIHAAAGAQLYEACLAVPEVEAGVRCPAGQARITPGFFLRARYVIHTVGPRYESPERSAMVLRQAHLSCLRLALDHRLSSIAFPAISCGIFGYPVTVAAQIAVTACRHWWGAIPDIRFVLFSHSIYAQWSAVARAFNFNG